MADEGDAAWRKLKNLGAYRTVGAQQTTGLGAYGPDTILVTASAARFLCGLPPRQLSHPALPRESNRPHLRPRVPALTTSSRLGLPSHDLSWLGAFVTTFEGGSFRLTAEILLLYFSLSIPFAAPDNEFAYRLAIALPYQPTLRPRTTLERLVGLGAFELDENPATVGI